MGLRLPSPSDVLRAVEDRVTAEEAVGGGGVASGRHRVRDPLVSYEAILDHVCVGKEVPYSL